MSRALPRRAPASPSAELHACPGFVAHCTTAPPRAAPEGSSPDPGCPSLILSQGTGDRAEAAVMLEGPPAAPGPCGACDPQRVRWAWGGQPGLCPPPAPRWHRDGFSRDPQPEGGTPRHGLRTLPKEIPGRSAGGSGRSAARLGLAACGSAQLANWKAARYIMRGWKRRERGAATPRATESCSPSPD